MKSFTMMALAVGLSGLAMTAAPGDARAEVQQVPQDQRPATSDASAEVAKPMLDELWGKVLWRQDTSAKLSATMVGKEELRAQLTDSAESPRDDTAALP